MYSVFLSGGLLKNMSLTVTRVLPWILMLIVNEWHKNFFAKCYKCFRLWLVFWTIVKLLISIGVMISILGAIVNSID